MKDVQCYELFGGIALKNHAFLFSFFSFSLCDNYAVIFDVCFFIDYLAYSAVR